jgi:Dyp-type peroxidase family
MATEPVLDVDDIQGHILPGYGPSGLRLIAMRADDGDSLRGILQTVEPMVVSARVSMGMRAQRKAALIESRTIPDEGLRVNIALTRNGLDLLGYREKGVDIAFDAGMTGLSTGDAKLPRTIDGAPEPACPSNWLIGGRNHPFDILILIFSSVDTSEESAPFARQLQQLTGTHFVRDEFGNPLPGEKEHFGFRDGISSPGPYGQYIDEAGNKQYLTTRYGVPNYNGLDYGKPGQPLVWPGRFLVGPPDLLGGSRTHVGTIWENGSFLVFRRLEQDVRSFYADTDRMAASLRSNVPDLSGEALRAAIVGRKPDGQSLMRSGPEDTLSINHFFYAGDTPLLNLAGKPPIQGAPRDVGGRTCPVWSHVRKVNPRDGANDLSTEAHNLQMLRRGVPFGPLYDHYNPDADVNLESRGLFFLAYQRSIASQFENLNSHWMNQFEVPAGGGHDLLVGLALTSGRLGTRKANWPISQTEFSAPNTWVRPTGGGYLFAPSLSILSKFATTAGPE